MATTTPLTEARTAQINRALTQFVNDFVSSIGALGAKEKFLSIYHPSIQWYDHAFHIQRIGHDAVLGLQKGFLYTNDPFKVDIKAIIPTPEGGVVEQVWVGTSSRDLIRPNGDVAIKASGRAFQCHVCMVVKIDAEGLITRIDEYYNKAFDTGVREEGYQVLQ